MLTMKRIPLLLVVLASLAASAIAQVPYSTGTYTQSFDSLITSGSTPWIDNLTVPGFYSYMIKKAAPFPWLMADTGKNGSTATIYSYGATLQPERALGMMPGSTPGDVEMGVRITNNSGHTLTSFTASYDGEEWRACCTSPQMLQVDYYLGSPATLDSGTWNDLSAMDFSGPIVSATGNYSLDGNAAANSIRNISRTVSPIVWPAGSDLWIRWKNASLPGANASLAIDNFRFSASNAGWVFSLWPMPSPLPTPIPNELNHAIYPMPRTDWLSRVQSNNDKAHQSASSIHLIFDGDSITDFWQTTGKTLWTQRYVPLGAFDFGISGDCTENLLWRLSQGQADGVQPNLIVLLIGTNNMTCTAAQIADGVKAVVNDYRNRCPKAVILLQAIFPRGQLPTDPNRLKVQQANAIIATFGDGQKIIYTDFGSKFLNADGTISASIMPDYLHPSAQGYQIWADSIQPFITQYCGTP